MISHYILTSMLSLIAMQASFVTGLRNKHGFLIFSSEHLITCTPTHAILRCSKLRNPSLRLGPVTKEAIDDRIEVSM